jgi:hypothetical protein
MPESYEGMLTLSCFWQCEWLMLPSKACKVKSRRNDNVQEADWGLGMWLPLSRASYLVQQGVSLVSWASQPSLKGLHAPARAKLYLVDPL